ncbi:unnamed protein product [Leptosia nina]|uniref:Uncharacterized protein n=1 Tax=Leptosia nina TaxID=320188 RepID=A0AAV1JZ90_9NEOP
MLSNNFEHIRSTWRLLSGETVQFKKLPSMSGDSSHQHMPKKIEEESGSDNKTSALLGSATTGTALHSISDDNLNKNEKHGDPEITPIKEEVKDTSFDTEKEKHDSDYLDNEVIIKPPSAFDEKSLKDKVDDNVDSVFLRPPPAHKVRPRSPAQEEETCGMKCLYYTLACCDCVLM